MDVARSWPAPVAPLAPGTECADVTDIRVCWDDGGSPTLVPRPLPTRAAPTPAGFRCVGQGPARVCEARDDSPFFCDASVCVEEHPRQPDDGTWQCSDDSGAVVCTGGEPPAGSPPTRVASGWVCGEKVVASPATRIPGGAGRVCVDLSPDFPSGSARALRCTWSYARGAARTCAVDPQAHSLGDACDASHPCVRGALCASGRCAPPRPRPACAIDGDCAAGDCRFGTCTKGPP